MALNFKKSKQTQDTWNPLFKGTKQHNYMILTAGLSGGDPVRVTARVLKSNYDLTTHCWWYFWKDKTAHIIAFVSAPWSHNSYRFTAEEIHQPYNIHDGDDTSNIIKENIASVQLRCFLFILLKRLTYGLFCCCVHYTCDFILLPFSFTVSLSVHVFSCDWNWYWCLFCFCCHIQHTMFGGSVWLNEAVLLVFALYLWSYLVLMYYVIYRVLSYWYLLCSCKANFYVIHRQ